MGDNSEIYQKRGIVLENGYEDRGGPPIETFLCLKMAIDKSAAFCCCIVFTVTIGVFSYATYLVQREGNDSGEVTFFKCIWGTMFLLFRGVSRFESYDTPGRLIELLIVIFGILTVAFLIAIVTSGMDVTSNEQFAITWLTRHEKLQQRQVMGAELIQAAWRIHQLQVKS